MHAITQAARQSGVKLLAAVLGLHSCGFAIGYGASRVLGLSEKVARTNSIEVRLVLLCAACWGVCTCALHMKRPALAIFTHSFACLHPSSTRRWACRTARSVRCLRLCTSQIRWWQCPVRSLRAAILCWVLCWQRTGEIGRQGRQSR